MQKGTGTKAQMGCPAAGKTGTTDNFNDAWFVGLHAPPGQRRSGSATRTRCARCAACTAINVAGGTFPTQIWGAFMSQAKGSDCGEFPKPDDARRSSRRSTARTRSTGKAPSKDGDYSSGGGGGGGGTSAGGGGSSGYDPRLYADPPQAPPEHAAAAEPTRRRRRRRRRWR